MECGVFTTLYSSHLMALLNSKSGNVPFKDLYDLAQQIEAGKKQIFLESPHGSRYKMLTDPNFERSKPMQALYEAVKNTKYGPGLDHEHNLEKLCTKMDSSSKYVLFAHDEMIRSTQACAACFWKYDVVEDPSYPLSWTVSNKTHLGRYADVLAHAMENYKRSLLHRTHPEKCVKLSQPETMLIGQRQLFLAYCFLGLGLLAGGTVLAVERRVGGEGRERKGDKVAEGSIEGTAVPAVVDCCVQEYEIKCS